MHLLFAAVRHTSSLLVSHFESYSTHSKQPPPTDVATHSSFYASNCAQRIHHSKQRFHINHTLCAKLRLIHDTLSLPRPYHLCPITHLVPHSPAASIHGDSSLSATGGYSTDLGFWWYREWPPKICTCTLHFVHNDKTKQLICNNELEYAAILINYLETSWFTTTADTMEPYPMVWIESNNTTSEVWSWEGCKDSLGGCALSCIHSALLLGNWVGVLVAHSHYRKCHCWLHLLHSSCH